MTSTALETGNIIHDIIKAFLERLLKSEDPVNRVFKEEKTGKQLLQLPMPDNATIEKLMQAGQAVFGMLIKKIKDGNL